MRKGPQVLRRDRERTGIVKLSVPCGKSLWRAVIIVCLHVPQVPIRITAFRLQSLPTLSGCIIASASASVRFRSYWPNGGWSSVTKQSACGVSSSGTPSPLSVLTLFNSEPLSDFGFHSAAKRCAEVVSSILIGSTFFSITYEVFSEPGYSQVAVGLRMVARSRACRRPVYPRLPCSRRA